jgi:hypothetical protein
MVDINLDGDEYVVKEPSTDKENPALDPVVELRIKETGKTQKRISIWEIVNPGDKYVFNFQVWKQGGSRYEPFQQEEEIQITGTDADVFREFIKEFEQVEDIDSQAYLLTENDPDFADLLSQIISHVDGADTETAQSVLTKMVEGIAEFGGGADQIELSDDILEGEQALKAEGMIQHARIRQGVERLEKLVEAEEVEQEFQDHLDDHKWFFGSRYIRDHDRYILGKKEVDFALESINGYLDIIELKRPQHTVVRFDDSHEMYYPSGKLNRATAQLQNYMRKAEKKETHILDEHDVRPLKPRGTVVIGADLNEEEREGVRVISSHLNNIEIITYTDLVKRGRQMLNFYERDDNENGEEK